MKKKTKYWIIQLATHHYHTTLTPVSLKPEYSLYILCRSRHVLEMTVKPQRSAVLWQTLIFTNLFHSGPSAVIAFPSVTSVTLPLTFLHGIRTSISNHSLFCEPISDGRMCALGICDVPGKQHSFLSHKFSKSRCNEFMPYVHDLGTI